ncbi:hypothetical protein NH340_JMT09162 [Sarcoptes scabiei]|nr:hypothetical protein NH340_JMT09162 [Sarcoptes scabiei]
MHLKLTQSYLVRCAFGSNNCSSDGASLLIILNLFVITILGDNVPILYRGAPWSPEEYSKPSERSTHHINRNNHYPTCKGEHEKWTTCSECQKTCRQQNLVFCKGKCTPGCECLDGFVRENLDGSGYCIRVQECQRKRHKCGRHQHWTLCNASPQCEATCKIPNGDRPCPYICKEGCTCDQGYVREKNDGTGKCIRPEDCYRKPRCFEHQYWSKCGKNCQRSCHNLRRRPHCYHPCRSGCVCKRGFVRRNSDYTGPCIQPKKCPRRHRRKCPKNQHFTKSRAGCDPTCRDPYAERDCPEGYRAGCTCNKGYYRRNTDGTGPCVRWKQCRKKCKRNEKFSKCDAACQPTCRRRHPRCHRCKSGCVCRKGFIRKHLNGPCIRIKNC